MRNLIVVLTIFLSLSVTGSSQAAEEYPMACYRVEDHLNPTELMTALSLELSYYIANKKIDLVSWGLHDFLVTWFLLLRNTLKKANENGRSIHLKISSTVGADAQKQMGFAGEGLEKTLSSILTCWRTPSERWIKSFVKNVWDERSQNAFLDTIEFAVANGASSKNFERIVKLATLKILMEGFKLKFAECHRSVEENCRSLPVVRQNSVIADEQEYLEFSNERFELLSPEDRNLVDLAFSSRQTVKRSLTLIASSHQNPFLPRELIHLIIMFMMANTALQGSGKPV